MKMTQKIRDAIGNIADVIKRVGHDGKEHVIIKKSYKNILPKPEQPVVIPEKEDIAKLVAMRMKDWKRK
jgi:hypothetical protein